MTAPIPRETADHAELARLAEAATRGDWKAHVTTKRPPEIYTNAPPPNTPNPKIAGPVLRKADARFIAAANPATVLALLSEIAALRGEVENLYREDLKVMALSAMDDDLQAMTARATQAERQRDELRKALEFYAQPIWSIRGEFPEASPHSEYRPDCGDTARQALANQGADQ